MYIKEHVGFDIIGDKPGQHSNKFWWLFDSRESSGKTCPTCLGLHMTHYRGDEVPDAFPYHTHMRVNRLRAKVHPHCRCVLAWTGRTKTVMKNPYGVSKREAKKAVLPDKVAGRDVVLSPSQRRLYKRTSKFARETFRGKKRNV